MLRDDNWTQDNNADPVQDLAMRRVPRQAKGAIHHEDRGRSLSLKAVLLHDAHLQKGVGHSEKCPICRQGLEGALEAPQKDATPDRDDEMVPSPGGDTEGPATPPYGDGSYEDRKDPLLWR